MNETTAIRSYSWLESVGGAPAPTTTTHRLGLIFLFHLSQINARYEITTFQDVSELWHMYVKIVEFTFRYGDPRYNNGHQFCPGLWTHTQSLPAGKLQHC